MRIIAYNIKRGGRGREHPIAEVLQSAAPDLVVLEEAGNPTVVETIARQADYPHFASRPGHSVAFISRIPVTHQWQAVQHTRTPFLEIRLQKHDFAVFGVHLSALLTNKQERRRVSEVRELLEVVASVKSTPHLLIGDFNAIAPGDVVQTTNMPFWLRTIIWLNRGIRRDALNTLQQAGYVDAFRHLNPDEPGYSLPTPSPNSRLDYAFIPAAHIGLVKDCQVVHEPEAVNTASDHFPLCIDLALE